MHMCKDMYNYKCYLYGHTVEKVTNMPNVREKSTFALPKTPHPQVGQNERIQTEPKQ